MKRNLKRSISSIFIVVIVFFITVMFSTASKPINQIELKRLSGSEDKNTKIEEESTKEEKVLKYSKPSVLGMGLFSTSDPSIFEGYLDTLLASGFTELRIDIPNYQDAVWLSQSKEAVIKATARGAKVIWGVSSYDTSNPEYTITAENWPYFRQAILDNAKWAQDNGVYEFQLGNEEEMHIWRHPISIIRTSNIATATFGEDHGFTSANPVIIWGGSPSDFNAYSANPVAITVTGPKTFTYHSAGNDGSVSNPRGTFIGNISEAAIQSNIKALAAEVQAIFTRGNISYTSSGSYFMDKWHVLGRGEIDILAWNVYSNQDGWQNDITNMVNWWGPDNTYITEFNLNYNSLNDYSTDEAVQAAALASMVEYIKASGIARAYYFCYPGDRFGILKSDGT
ncbi:MAG: hypothetical protein K8S14_08815, partial [Actinomycetia bacterium]|nr:hypothetical protein [Actinomycetes bacterium]